MADRMVVGVVATPQPWRGAFEFFVADHIAAVELVALHDPSDVSGDVECVVVDDTLNFLTPVQVLALRDQGVRLVGVYDPTGRRGRGQQALEGLGLDAVVSADAGPEALVDAVAYRSPLRQFRGDGRTGLHQPASEPRPGERGRLIVVGGGSDAPGRTETGIGVAASLARRGESVVLVDLDEHNPTVARRLGYQLSPNVLDVLNAVATGANLHPAVGRRAGSVGVGEVPFDVVPGLANPADWGQMQDVSALLDAAARQWRWVVVDTGPECSPDQVPPGGARNAATRIALRSADQVIAVCNGTRTGVLRLLDWAASAAELVDGPAVVAINRAPRQGFRQGELRGQVVANLPGHLAAEVAFVPADPLVAAADWDAAVTPRGPFVAAVEGLVDRFGPGRVAQPRRLARLIGAGR